MGGTTGLRRRICLVLGLLLMAGLLTLPANAADPQEQLQENQERLERIQNQIERANDKQDSLTEQILDLDAERAEVQDKVETLDGELAVLNGRIATLTERLEETQARLAVVTKELKKLEKELAISERIHEERAVATYIAGPTAEIDALLSAESFGDLSDRYEYYQAALEQDALLIDKIDGLRIATSDKQAEIEEAEAELASAKKQLEADRDELAAARAAKEAVLAEKQAVINTKDGLLASVKQQEEKLEVARDRIQEDSARIEALLRARAAAASSSSSSSSGAGAPAGPMPKGGGSLAWPAAGSVTSPYGYRIHPIFGYSRLHTGIDIGAGYGAPVVAAGDGEVAFVGVMSGYGNVVVVDHGGGMATTYNHLSAFQVSTGESVGRGEVIAAVGCTGWCTGPHLHFEVRINGSPVDPMPYLS
jgi:murein DD-endopeptidase MepM/ murein hydrolase activator NlpD